MLTETGRATAHRDLLQPGQIGAQGCSKACPNGDIIHWARDVDFPVYHIGLQICETTDGDRRWHQRAKKA
jgi:hypothetical protein